MKKRILFLIVIPLLFAACSKPEGVANKENAEKKWGGDRVCMPCHLEQQPIAREHNYRCDTCHRGNPWAEDKEDGHFGLVRNPQAPENISKTCDSCHRRQLGRDVPYNAEFVKDIIVSHKITSQEANQWHD